MTATQKIMCAKAGLEKAEAGDLIECSLDLVFGNEVMTPIAINEFYATNATEVFDRDRVVIIPDHFIPNCDIASAHLAKVTRDFAADMNLTHYFEIGRGGIEHALLPEKGFIKPGMVVIGADSHSCTHGALGAFATGVGATDFAVAMATGKAWFRVPEAIKITFTGSFSPMVSGKDAALYIIGMLGVDGARYASIEFDGNIAAISMDDRFTIANMMVEAGAKNTFFPVDDIAAEYLHTHGVTGGTSYTTGSDDEYIANYTVELDKLPIMVAYPHLPENVRDIQTAVKGHIKIDQVVIGSCTNGRITDMRRAAQILKGQKIANNVRCIIFPATQEIWLQCVKEGLMDIFAQAGAVVSAPTCGPCFGGHFGILDEGEKCLSTTNRNFVGRMGHKKSEVYLSSPAVAAMTAITGYISDPREGGVL